MTKENANALFNERLQMIEEYSHSSMVRIMISVVIPDSLSPIQSISVHGLDTISPYSTGHKIRAVYLEV